MVKWKIYLFIFLLIPGIGCKNNKPSQPLTADIKSNQFIPVTDFILGELHKIDSLSITPLKITTENNHIDSQWLQKKNVITEAAAFLQPIIDSAHLHNYFTERSFLDQTINSYTFAYDPIKSIPSGMNLLRWDVYVDPLKQNITRIYILKRLSDNPKETLEEQLTWKTGRSFKITLIKESKNQKAQIKEQEVIWDFPDPNNN